jgi:hypothetical protein
MTLVQELRWHYYSSGKDGGPFRFISVSFSGSSGISATPKFGGQKCLARCISRLSKEDKHHHLLLSKEIVSVFSRTLQDDHSEVDIKMCGRCRVRSDVNFEVAETVATTPWRPAQKNTRLP